MGPRVSLHTLGCRLNQAETSVLADSLRRKGYHVVPYGRETDVLVLNTCSVTENAEKDCRYAIRKTLRHSPEAFVAVTGCYAQTGADQLREIPGIDLLIGSQFKMQLPDYLPEAATLRKRPTPEVVHTRSIDREDFTLPGAAYSDSTRALLKVQDGCNFMCSFCLIPFARGRERSRTLPDLLREARSLALAGHRELVLTGVNIGQYEYEGAGLVEVIRHLEDIPEVARIRISSIEPTTVTDALLAHMAQSSKLCHYLHIPIQSADDQILASMNRRYTADEYRSIIERASMAIPDLGLGTDVMVGFPGEDEAAFTRTHEFVDALPFSYCHVFSYSERPGTAAVKLSDKVTPARIAERSRLLAELSSRKLLGFHHRHLGMTLPVLFEHRVKQGRRLGTTGNFLRVSVPDVGVAANLIEDVVITGSNGDTALGHVRAAQPAQPTPLRMVP